jgi:16S rRNA processing protein RimM
MSENKKVPRIIGVIGKPHGMKGYSYVRLITDYPDTICKEDILYLDHSCTKKLKIEDIKNIILKGQTRVIFKFYEYDDNINAENLRDASLYRAPARQPGLKKDSHWIDELIGCSIFLQKGSPVIKENNSNNSGDYIGVVDDVKSYAYNDNLIVAAPGGKTIIIPMYEEYIERIDVKGKKIFLKSLPEYI